MFVVVVADRDTRLDGVCRPSEAEIWLLHAK
jgi:hypothetical protein